MQLGNGYSIKAENYHKPTPKWLKLTADILLLITMFADFAMPWLNQMPEMEKKTWIIWVVSGVIVLFKFVTKCISDSNTQVG
jgi:hypothetical protein